MSQPQVKFYKTTYDPTQNNGAPSNTTGVIDGGIIKASDSTNVAGPRLYIKDGDTVSTVGESLQEAHINTKGSFNVGTEQAPIIQKNEWAITDKIEGTSALYNSNSFYKVLINKELNNNANFLEIQKHTKTSNGWSSSSPLVINSNGTILCGNIMSGDLVANNVTSAYNVVALGDILLGTHQTSVTNSITGLQTDIDALKEKKLYEYNITIILGTEDIYQWDDPGEHGYLSFRILTSVYKDPINTLADLFEIFPSAITLSCTGFYYNTASGEGYPYKWFGTPSYIRHEVEGSAHRIKIGYGYYDYTNNTCSRNSLKDITNLITSVTGGIRQLI